MSEYEDLKRSLEERDLLINSVYKQLNALDQERGAIKALMDEALVREKEKIELIPGEAVEVRDLDSCEWRLGEFVSKGTKGLFIVKLFMSHKGYIEIGWIQCRRPKDREGILIRHVGSECPVSDKDTKVMVLIKNGYVNVAKAGTFHWSQNNDDQTIMGYVIIPKWAMERVK